jgi:hypothetical protein
MGREMTAILPELTCERIAAFDDELAEARYGFWYDEADNPAVITESDVDFAGEIRQADEAALDAASEARSAWRFRY